MERAKTVVIALAILALLLPVALPEDVVERIAAQAEADAVMEMSRAATLCPGGTRPLTLKFSIAAPPMSWLRAITTSSAACKRI